jgi:hypothetical protein
MTESIGDKPVVEEPVVEEPIVDEKQALSNEVADLRSQLLDRDERINRYDGDRKNTSEQLNNLTRQVDELTEQLSGQATDDDDDSQYESITRADLDEYKKGESIRFKKFEKDRDDATIKFRDDYTESLSQSSLSIKNQETFAAICKEHDTLVAAGAMPQSTGDAVLDGKLGWKEAEASHYKKMLAAGKTVPFNDTTTVSKPVVPGNKELSTPTNTTAKSMPDLPDDAKAFLAEMGGDADFVTGALKK